MSLTTHFAHCSWFGVFKNHHRDFQVSENMTRLNTLPVHIYASDNSIKFKIQKKKNIYIHTSQSFYKLHPAEC